MDNESCVADGCVASWTPQLATASAESALRALWVIAADLGVRAEPPTAVSAAESSPDFFFSAATIRPTEKP